VGNQNSVPSCERMSLFAATWGAHTALSVASPNLGIEQSEHEADRSATWHCIELDLRSFMTWCLDTGAVVLLGPEVLLDNYC
jgi:hypothetical protein